MDRTPAERLALARLLVAGAAGLARSKLGTDLRPMLGGPPDRALEALEAAGAIGPILDKKGKPTAKFALTDRGRREALDALGLEQLPPKTTWAKLKATHLPALALGRPGRPVGALKAEILRAHYGLDLGEKPTLKQASDAMAAKLLGLGPGEPFNAESILRKLLVDAGIDLPPGAKKATPAAIGEALFRRELGDPSAKQPLDLIATARVGARNQTAAELGSAILRTWASAIDPAGDEPSDSVESAPLELSDFARRVVEAARASPTGWFGDDAVFISRAWRSLGDDPSFRGMDLATFKGLLIEAHRARLLELARADLVEAMDGGDVGESATPYLNAVYHFVRVEGQDR